MAKNIGVRFDGIHSWTDWGLRLKEMKIGLPKIKTAYLEVPGMNGSLDLTEAQNGGVKYGNRELEFKFDARNCGYQKWLTLVSNITAEIHGQKKKIIIDTDPGFYYSGRCSVESKKDNDVLAEIIISCDCDPFKIDVAALNEPWVWDTFSFIDGVVRKTHEIMINSLDSWQEVRIDGWIHNEVLRVIADKPMSVKFKDNIYELEAGENKLYEVEILEGKNYLYFKGEGKILILQIGGMI